MLETVRKEVTECWSRLDSSDRETLQGFLDKLRDETNFILFIFQNGLKLFKKTVDLTEKKIFSLRSLRSEDVSNPVLSFHFYFLGKLFFRSYSFKKASKYFQLIVAHLRLDSYHKVKFLMKVHFNLYRVGSRDNRRS